MRVEAICEIALVTVVVIAALFSSIVIEFGLFGNVAAFRVIKYTAIAFTLSYILSQWIRSKPYIKTIRADEWKKNEVIESHLDVWLDIPARVHRKGKYPKVEFIKLPESYSYLAYDHVVDEKGNVTIYHPTNKFLPVFNDVVVKITA